MKVWRIDVFFLNRNLKQAEVGLDIMPPLTYRLVFIGLFCLVSAAYGSENVTIEEVPVEALVNLTGNNELWTVLLKDCKKPTLICVQNNIFKYLKTTLDETEDLQFNNFLKFSKNKLNYASADRAFETNSTDEEVDDDVSPIESMARTLKDNTAKFFLTHDLEVALPEGLLPNSVLKIAPRGFGNNAAQVHLEIVSKDLDEARALEEGGRTFKRIRKWRYCWIKVALDLSLARTQLYELVISRLFISSFHSDTRNIYLFSIGADTG